jgi:hypothetical protein
VTKRKSTDLARKRAVNADIRRITEVVDATALVQPPIAATLDTTRRVIARELEFMERAQASGEAMSLPEAKKLAALIQALGGAATIERMRAEDGVDDMTDQELDAEIDRRVAEKSAKR